MTTFSGKALSTVLGDAAEAAIGEAIESRTARLGQVLIEADQGRNAPSPPLWGRAGEGGEPPVSSVEQSPSPASPLPDPPPQGGRGADGPRRVTAKRGDTSVLLTLSAPGLFAREFGALGVPADPLLGPAIDAVRRRRA